jgi:hypothetical protein
MFINAIDTTKEIETNLPPLGLGYLVSSLRNEFGPDCIEFKIVDRDIKAVIKIRGHFMTIFSLSINCARQYPHFFRVIARLRQSQAPDK